jgi:mono/diheme cytochrome c family protein
VRRTQESVASALALCASIVLGACHQEFEAPDRAARVARADALFATAAFDTVEWSADSAPVSEGNLVYTEECRRCHGTLGGGTTDYARERDLEVPSLVERGWPLAQVDSLRRKIYIGHESGMPIFGDADLSLRQIDAAAAYILLTLRPEVLEEG